MIFLWFTIIFQIFSQIKKKIKRQNLHRQKFVLKHIILCVHRVYLLMWSPTKLNFLFYIFFFNQNNFKRKRQNYNHCSKTTIHCSKTTIHCSKTALETAPQFEKLRKMICLVSKVEREKIIFFLAVTLSVRGPLLDIGYVPASAQLNPLPAVHFSVQFLLLFF